MSKRITDYTNVSTANPNKLSLVDISELLANNTFDSRKITLENLSNYFNPIPYPCITVVINGFDTITPTLTTLKNTIDTTNPTLVKDAGGNYRVLHSSFSTDATQCVIVHSGTSYTGGMVYLYTQTTGEIRFYTMINGTQSDNAMKQVVITYYKTN